MAVGAYKIALINLRKDRVDALALSKIGDPSALRFAWPVVEVHAHRVVGATAIDARLLLQLVNHSLICFSTLSTPGATSIVVPAPDSDGSTTAVATPLAF